MKEKEQKIKSVVWDLDNTIWHGILSENSNVNLNYEAINTIKNLDQRGILQSIASKNNYDDAMQKLKEFDLSQYFLYPKINWQPKSQSITEIAKNINIGIDTFAFIDDQPFELDEVKFSLPHVMCISANNLNKILDQPRFIPRFITEDTKKRRHMYQCDIHRNMLEETFEGSKEDFLRTLNMKFTVAEATENDLKRAEELTVRTHQLNTTGYPYSYKELKNFCTANTHKLLVAELQDKYGPYGKIGLALLETLPDKWCIKLLLMSCRVMSRGVGSVLITIIRNLAQKAGVRLTAEFINNDRNRMMYMTYKFSGFVEKENKKNCVLLENDLSSVPTLPNFLEINNMVEL